MKDNLTEGMLNGPAEISAIFGLLTQAGVVLPESYIDFLKKHDGGEGFIGDNYIIFWKAEELVLFNHEYEVEKYAPGIFRSLLMVGVRDMGSTLKMQQCR
jgi:hypothetical protein